MIRKVHLDFHTAPETTGIGAAFDPEVFAETLKGAHVNYIATPGKCQFGCIYHDSNVGPAHPHLVRPDLFPETVRACVERGIKVQAYFTLGIDDLAVERRPEWQQRFKDGTGAGWVARLTCYASSYIDEAVIPEVQEMIDRCPGISGFWFDIGLYISGAFYSPAFNELAAKRLGADADDEMARWMLAREIVRERCIQIDAAIREKMPDADNYFNSLVTPGEPGNIPLQQSQEVEYPVLFHTCEGISSGVRWLRWHNSPVIGLVSRFMGPWMDPGTVRTEDQMRFDVGRVVSLGAHVSMGDHRHPDGTIDPEVYSRLGAVYADVEAAEPWLDDAKPCTEAVLLTEIDRGDPYLMPTLPKSTLEAARMLEEIGLQFDIVSVEEKLPSTDLVIWPGASPGTMELVEQLKKHVERGGSLLAMGAAADSPGFADAFGIKTSPCERENDFVRAIPELGVSTFAHVMTTAAPMIDPDAACITLADRLPSASLRPPCAGSESMGPAVVQKGRVVYSGAPLFVENALSATPYPREVLEAIINRLLEKRLVRHDAGNTVAAHLLKSKHGYTLHLLHWAMERWPKQPNPAASFPNIGPVKVTLRVPERVSEVTLEPGGSRIDFAWSNGTCTFTVPHMKVWQMVGIKTGS